MRGRSSSCAARTRGRSRRPSASEFHAPDDWLAGPRAAAPGGHRARHGPGRRQAGRRLVPPRPHLARIGAELVAERVARMALVSHFIPVETRFHETNVDVTYSRYRRRGDLSLDESFFPVVWSESGYRTPWLVRAAGSRLAGQEAPELLERLEDQPRRHRLRRAAHERRDEARERARSSASSTARTRPSVIACSSSVAVETVLVREGGERFLAAEREDQLLARDAELARDSVDRGERDPLERLARAVRVGLARAPRTDPRPASARTVRRRARGTGRRRPPRARARREAGGRASRDASPHEGDWDERARA